MPVQLFLIAYRLRPATDLLIKGVEGELCCVVSAAQLHHVAPHHTRVRLAIVLTVPLPILLYHLK